MIIQPFLGFFHGDLDFFDLHEKKNLETAENMFFPHKNNNVLHL